MGDPKMLMQDVAAARRTLLAGAGAALLLPGAGWTKMPMGLAQALHFCRFKPGNAEHIIVTDDQLPLGDFNAAFPNISQDEIVRRLHGTFLSTRSAVLEQNVLVVTTGDRGVLFDTGMGGGTLLGNVVKAGDGSHYLPAAQILEGVTRL